MGATGLSKEGLGCLRVEQRGLGHGAPQGLSENVLNAQVEQKGLGRCQLLERQGLGCCKVQRKDLGCLRVDKEGLGRSRV